MKRVMAVDLGASGGKCFAGVFGDDGSFSMNEVHRFAHEAVSFHVPDRNGTVTERTQWDDTLLYQNILHGLHSYRREISARLDSLGIDAWGADGSLMSEDGELLGKVYAYRDHRLDNMVEAVKARIDARRIYEITGIHFQPFNVSNQLLWLVLNRRDLIRPGAFYLPIPSLFYFYLGGTRQVDSSWASVTQLMDAPTKTWSHEVLDALGIPREIMPPIVAPGAVLGEFSAPVANALGLSRAKLIAVGSHDTASAYAAAPVSNTQEALIISSGTWSLVGKLIPQPITSAEAMAANLSNEGGIGNIRFLRNCMGSWLAQELRRVWRLADGREPTWAETDQWVQKARPFAAFVDPDDPGFYNPANMETAIAEFCKKTGQTAPADRGSMVRTIYESLALKYRMVNELICRVSKTTTRVVHIVGGGSRNVMLNQFTADACGLPVVAGPEEATAVGNIMVQAVGLGLIPSLHEAQPIIRRAFPIRDYKPEQTEVWNAAYGKFKAVVAKAAGAK